MRFKYDLPYDIYANAVRAYFDRTRARIAEQHEIFEEYAEYGWRYESPSKVEQIIKSTFPSKKHATMFILRFAHNG